LRPLTIKQVLDASQPHVDADFLVDGVELGNVRPPAAVFHLVS
jgi:hypothetical protein